MRYKKFEELEFSACLSDRKVYLTKTVDEYSIWPLIGRLETLIFENKKSPCTLVICSYGGYVDYGTALYDFIKNSKTPIYTLCQGVAASMAAVLLAGGPKGHRVITVNSRVMIHQPSSGYIGKASDIEVHAKETLRTKEKLIQLLANDTGQSYSRVKKDMEKDYWMNAEEALAYGIVDRIIK